MITDEAGIPVAETRKYYLIVKPVNMCGGIANRTNPAAQLGSSFMNLFPSIVFDPNGQMVWVKKNSASHFASAALDDERTHDQNIDDDRNTVRIASFCRATIDAPPYPGQLGGNARVIAAIGIRGSTHKNSARTCATAKGPDALDDPHPLAAANISRWCHIPIGGRIGAAARVPALSSVDLVGQHSRQIAIFAEGNMPGDPYKMREHKEIDQILAGETNIVRRLRQTLIVRQQRHRQPRMRPCVRWRLRRYSRSPA